MNKTIVIPAAGTGSRLKEYTQNFNKAMCTLGPKPIISYIIEKFTKNDQIIILLGYKGDLLKQVVKACYPDWDIKFVEVDNFEGPGSGLGYSLSKARDLLQKPFIFWSNDTLVEEDISKFDYSSNWMMVSKFDESKALSYRHAKVSSGNVLKILAKGNYDETGKTTFPYIGVSFIRDYETFWKALDDSRDIFIAGGESVGLNSIISKPGNVVKCYKTETWIDTGNKQVLEKYKKIYNERMEETILEKPTEAIWFIGDKVIKFHLDEKFIADRVERFHTFVSPKMQKAGFLLPKLLSYDKNLYVYERAPGKIASEIINPTLFSDMLYDYFSGTELYRGADVDDIKKTICEDFYKNKTLKRIKEYCKAYEELDRTVTINGLKCGSARDLVEKVDWEKIASECLPSKNFHGDFHLENILRDEQSKKWILLDWRQNFGKTGFIGDLVYDAGKMWHSLIVNHKMVKADLFTVKYLSEGNVEIDIHRTFIDTKCEEELIKILDGLNILDVSQFMTALIFLNICACHEGEYNTFLFLLGKYLMNKFYIEHQDYFKGDEKDVHDDMDGEGK